MWALVNLQGMEDLVASDMAESRALAPISTWLGVRYDASRGEVTR